jgi:tight adherence protein C
MDATAALNLVAAGSAASGSLLAFKAYRRAQSVSDAEESSERDERTSLWRRLVSPLAIHFRPSTHAELEMMTTRLLCAGRRSKHAVDRFAEERVVALLAGGLACLFWVGSVGGFGGMLLGMVSLVLGILGPSKRLDMAATQRRDAISRGLPSAVDLLTTCIDAGLSLEQSIARVSRELELSAPVLADELMTTSQEFEAGVALPDALRRLARRVGLDDLSALCGVIAQASGLGAPIGNTLREYAESSRRKRMAMLEERAGKLAASMTIPLAVCLLPAAMMVILGPAVLQLVRALQ